MKIHFIGARGYPSSYASAEDLVRELAPRFAKNGHEVTVHGWENAESKLRGTRADEFQGVKREFHSTPGGKVSGQMTVAWKSSIRSAFSDADLVHYQYINSGIFGILPRLMGKKVVVNVNGQMWKDPKWPWGIRHLFFNLGALWCILFASKVITDSMHMSAIYFRRFLVRLPFIGYGCHETKHVPDDISSETKTPKGYYLIMSRITPHNLTDIMVEGFIKSGSECHLLVAGHVPDSPWFHRLTEKAKGHRVRLLGLVRDQAFLTQLIVNCRAYLHGHSLGGINPALVRVAGQDVPVIAVDTIFNREVLEPNPGRPLATLFNKNSDSVSSAICAFEENWKEKKRDATALGQIVRSTRSWESIFVQYKELYEELCKSH